MGSADKRLARAIRVTPSADRARRVPEWEGDYAAASARGARSARQVARGAEKVAWELRRRQVERLLTGAAGAGRALTAWLGLAVVACAAFLFAGPALLTLIVILILVGAVLLKAGSPSHWSHRLLMASGVVWIACSGFVWWATGERINAADDMRPESRLAALGGPVFVAGLLAFIAMIACVLIAVKRANRR